MARESAILGYSVAALLGLGCLYQLYRWCLYKVRKVKEDKKRVNEMLAQGLPGKLRYPIFSATAGLCCAIDAGDMEENVSETPKAVPNTVPTSEKAKTKRSTYTGLGANMDGPAIFIDLEANIQPNSNDSERKGTTVGKATTNIGAEESISDISGSTGDESAGESQSLSEETVIVSEESLCTEGSLYESAGSHSGEDRALSEHSVSGDEINSRSVEDVAVSEESEESEHSSALSLLSTSPSIAGSEQSNALSDWSNSVEDSCNHAAASDRNTGVADEGSSSELSEPDADGSECEEDIVHSR